MNLFNLNEKAKSRQNGGGVAGFGRLWLVLAGFAVAVGSVGLAGCGDKEKNTPGQQELQTFVGRSFKDITVQDLDGAPQKLNDPFILNGKPVVVNVWATWCAPCLAEMPKLAELGKQGKYTVLAISTDKDTQTVKDFLKKQTWGQGVTILFDPLGKVTREAMGAKTLPVTFVTTPDLTVKMAVAGERDWSHPSMQGKMVQALK